MEGNIPYGKKQEGGEPAIEVLLHRKVQTVQMSSCRFHLTTEIFVFKTEAQRPIRNLPLETPPTTSEIHPTDLKVLPPLTDSSH